MRVIQNLDEMTETARGWLTGGSVGFIPTMGYLHAGHMTLVQASRRACEFTVVSIFVNPLQFGPDEDPALYPRDLARDLQVLDSEQVDIAFVPRLEDIYPAHFSTYVTPTGPIARLLERGNRHHYARGVATVTAKLFQLVRPDVAFFSQKNAVHVALVRQLIRDLNMDISLRVLPTVRENDGLVTGYRNALLSPAERQAAAILYQALLAARRLIEKGERDVAVIERAMDDLVATAPLARLDYVTVCDPATFEQPAGMLANPLPDTLLLIAARVGNSYLLDNMLWMGDGYWLT